MSDLLFDSAMALAMLFAALNVWLLVREVGRLRAQVAFLTRRVWILEGHSPDDVCGECHAGGHVDA